MVMCVGVMSNLEFLDGGTHAVAALANRCIGQSPRVESSPSRLDSEKSTLMTFASMP